MDLSRRDFFCKGAAAGLGALGWAFLRLPANAAPTEESGDPEAPRLPERSGVTEDNIQGPFYRKGAPYRAKVSPPLASGTVLLVRGRVWGHDTRKPLSGAVLDLWHASAAGRYDNDDPAAPPAKGVYLYRTRLVTDEGGGFEYETVHPGPYDTRPSHIHYLVNRKGYGKLVTQMYFRGDPRNNKDPFVKKSLIVDVEKIKVKDSFYEAAAFDIVLAPV